MKKYLSVIPLALLLCIVVGCQGKASKSTLVESNARVDIEEGYFPGEGGVRLFYRKVGSGSETAVYLHGGPADMSDGGYELDALANGRTLIAFDQRSGGRSELVNDPELLTVDYYLRDIEALRQHFRLEKMILIGQSWGSGLAIQYSDRHPNRVTRLLLLSPMPPARDPFWSQRIEKTNSVIGDEGVARIEELIKEIGTAPDDQVQILFRDLIETMFRGYLNDLSALKRMKVNYWDASPKALRHELQAQAVSMPSLGNWDFRPILVSLKIPILVVEGAETHVPLEATREWVISASNARLLLVPKANHMTWLEGDVPTLLKQLNEFLAGQWPKEAEDIGGI
jgi:proline iminopeptidase